MATFTFWYDESASYRATFEAESLEEATELLRQVNDGEIMFDDLPEFGDKQKGNDIEVYVDTLAEVGA
jgi:hypothetical protein